MRKLIEAPAQAQTVVGVFRSEVAARDAMRMLETADMPPDRIGIVRDNVRQAREVAGSYSPQGAFIGALVGALIVAFYVAFGGDVVRQNVVAIVIGGVPIVGGLAFIGWLAGRARVFKDEEYAHLEELRGHLRSAEVEVQQATTQANGVKGELDQIRANGLSD